MNLAQHAKPVGKEKQLSPVKTARDKFKPYSANRISMKWFGIWKCIDVDRKATTEEVVDHLVYRANNLAGKGQFSKAYGNLEAAVGMCADSAKGFEIRKKMILSLGLSGSLEDISPSVALQKLRDIRDLEIKAEGVLSSKGEGAEAAEAFSHASLQASILSRSYSRIEATGLADVSRKYSVALSNTAIKLAPESNIVQEYSTSESR